MLITGVEEQFRVRGRLDEGTGGIDVALADEDRIGIHAVDCTGTSAGHVDPNSDVGTHEYNSNAPRAPARVCASFCAGSTPREKPA